MDMIPDTGELKYLQEAIKTAGQGVDLFKKLIPKVIPKWRKPADAEPSETDNLAQTFYGTSSDISDFNSALIDCITVNTQPFFIRVGEKITIPGELPPVAMKRSIEGPSVWDWHYVFNYKQMSPPDREHLQNTFLDENRQSVSAALSTTTLKLSQKRLPEHFERGVFIFGLETTNRAYTDLLNIRADQMIPLKVLLCLNSEKPAFSVIDDPVATRYWLTAVREFIMDVDSDTATPGFEARLYCGGEGGTEGGVAPIDNGSIAIPKALR
jgi:hypothetical protein